MSRPETHFSSERLLTSLARLPKPKKYWVGFSGGADSTALLQAMHECRDQLTAPIHVIHFHHGLQSDADAWQEHCRAFCAERSLPYLAERLELESGGRSSPEEAARNARYRAVAALIEREEMYLTAHHAEDLAETLFLNLMRGSGIEGLAGIPVLRNLEGGWVARPLLDMRRLDLEAYLLQRNIAWLEDPSNADTSFDRNYLRRDLFPLLERRWPGLVRRLSRTARNARITAGAMAMFIESQSGDLIRDRLKMPLRKLLELDPEMQTLILRQWLRRHEVPVLPEQRLREFLGQLSAASSDSRAEVQWEGWVIRHYQLDLWLHRNKPLMACPSVPWQEGPQLELGADSGLLLLRGEPATIPPGWRVRSRQPGDRIRMRAEGGSQKLKHFFQAASVPPWLRPGIPVLEWDGEPVALGDWIIGHRLHEWLLEHRVRYCWEPADPLLARVHSDCRRQVVDRRPPLG
ncbi:MAG TPA: tRNA lysidine(34) synthetase TilS [Xanthomonadales bacterium]|nr:tRNA lysidine(34) synthetase TilS [Xanthomonadales bacterium]